MYALIMAGGRGTRFWPESTSSFPKQYLPLLEGKPLVSETLRRLDSLVDIDKRYIVTVQEQEVLVRRCSVDQIKNDNIIFEPMAKNTAPCILLSLATLLKKGATPKDVVAIVPSDHVILNHQAFQKDMTSASALAQEQKKIVTIGILPTAPHTGYGYIHRGKKVGQYFEVQSFKEKPDFETAKNYLSSGEYYWNGGIFVASIEILLESFEKYASELYTHFGELRREVFNFEKLVEIYTRLPADSLDYAVMEKSEDILVIPASFDWNDLGSWEALENIHKQEKGNTLIKEKGHYFDRAQGNIINVEGKFIAMIGVNDLVVVANDKALLILPKKECQSVKKVTSWLETQDEYKDLI